MYLWSDDFEDNKFFAIQSLDVFLKWIE
jgi:hypothetical protein